VLNTISTKGLTFRGHHAHQELHQHHSPTDNIGNISKHAYLVLSKEHSFKVWHHRWYFM